MSVAGRVAWRPSSTREPGGLLSGPGWEPRGDHGLHPDAAQQFKSFPALRIRFQVP